jgi:hypothetical protein
MMLNRTKQHSLQSIVKQLQPFKKRKNFSLPAAAWVNTKCGINPLNPTFFKLPHSPFITYNYNHSNNTHRFTSQSFATSGAVAELEKNGGKTVSNAVTWNNGDDSSLAVTVERLESQTKEVLCKIDFSKQQWQKNPLPSPILPPPLRSQIITIIQSWGRLWDKIDLKSKDLFSNGYGNSKDCIPQSYIQQGVQASNQLLDAVLQDDLRICRTGGNVPLNSHVGKNNLSSCAIIVSCYQTRINKRLFSSFF